MSRAVLRDVVRTFYGQPGAREFFGRTEVPADGFLWSIIADICTGCTVSCSMCFNSERTRRELADDDVLRALVERVAPHAAEVAFGCRHENLLHPALPDLVADLTHARAGRSRPFLVLLTSGAPLGDDVGEALATCGLDLLLLSIPTTHEATFAAVRTPGSWAELRVRVEGFMSLRERPAVAAQTLVMRSTLPHLSTTLADLAELGLGRLHVNQMVVTPAQAQGELLHYFGPDRTALDRTMEGLEAAARRLGVAVERPLAPPSPIDGELFPLTGDGDVWDEHLVSPSVCASPWMKLRVDHEGLVFPCPFMMRPEHAWGSILEAELEAVVNGPAARRTRAELAAGRAPNEVCGRCPYGPRPRSAELGQTGSDRRP